MVSGLSASGQARVAAGGACRNCSLRSPTNHPPPSPPTAPTDSVLPVAIHLGRLSHRLSAVSATRLLLLTAPSSAACQDHLVNADDGAGDGWRRRISLLLGRCEEAGRDKFDLSHRWRAPRHKPSPSVAKCFPDGSTCHRCTTTYALSARHFSPA